MKLLLAIACFTCVLIVIEAVSPIKCPLDGCWPCKDRGPCKCGTYKDSCGCCDFCIKCPGEECNILAGHKCPPGYRCRNYSGLRQTIDPYGRCVKVEDTKPRDHH